METIVTTLEKLKTEEPDAYNEIMKMEMKKKEENDKWKIDDKDQIAVETREDYQDIDKYCSCETDDEKISYLKTFKKDYRRTMTLREHFIIMGCYNEELRDDAVNEIFLLTKFYNTQLKNNKSKSSDKYIKDTSLDISEDKKGACSSKDLSD